MKVNYLWLLGLVGTDRWDKIIPIKSHSNIIIKKSSNIFILLSPKKIVPLHTMYPSAFSIFVLKKIVTRSQRVESIFASFCYTFKNMVNLQAPCNQTPLSENVACRVCGWT